MIWVKLSIYQSHLIGHLVGRLLYKELPQSKEILSLVEYRGCPHDGGEHTFSFESSKEDAIVFLNLLIETYGNHVYYKDKPEFEFLKGFVEYIKNTNLRSYCIKRYILILDPDYFRR